MSSTGTPFTVPMIFRFKGLDVLQTKELIKGCENMGGINKVKLKEVCDAEPEKFGEASTELRRKFQRYHEKARRFYNRDISSYIFQLHKAGVNISEHTLNERDRLLGSAELDREGQDNTTVTGGTEDKKPSVS